MRAHVAPAGRAQAGPALLQWLAYGGAGRAAGRRRVRLTVEVPAGDGQARGRRTRRTISPNASRFPGFRAGKVPPEVLRLAGRQGAPLHRGGRVAHLELVLERGARQPRAPGRECPTSATSCRHQRRATTGCSPPSSPCRGRSIRPTGARSRCRGSRSRWTTSSSARGSRRCRGPWPRSLPVEGRAARARRRRGRRHPLRRRARAARLRRRARRRAARRRDRDGIRELAPRRERGGRLGSAPRARTAGRRSR